MTTDEKQDPIPPPAQPKKHGANEGEANNGAAASSSAPSAAKESTENNKAKGGTTPSEETGSEGQAPGAQFNAKTIYRQYNKVYTAHASEKNPLANLTVELAQLPPNVHPFQDPKHNEFIRVLEGKRMLLLSSYLEFAGYAAAYTVVNDPRFGGTKKRALFPTQHSIELNLLNLTDEALLGQEPQILLVEIEKECTLLKAALEAPTGLRSRAYERLERHCSYVVFSVRDDLVDDAAEEVERSNDLKPYPVSHLCYLLSRYYDGQAETFEQRLRTALRLKSSGRSAELRKHYPLIKEHLLRGTFEGYLKQLEEERDRPQTARAERPRPCATFPQSSEVHRTATFIGTYFPGLTQNDFDHLERLLLADSTTTKETVRQGFRRDGKLITTREKTVELCTDRWRREADSIFRKCSLRTMASENGSWFVDFREPQLRDELRSSIESHHSWYLRRQCDVLQKKGVLLQPELSAIAVDDLVQLFVGRAVADPASFGSEWLEDLVFNAFLLSVNALFPAEAMDRLALLIRAMLDQEGLNRVITEFCNRLLADKHHEALLALLISLVARLRPGSNFAPLSWMRRLLDEGNKETRAWTTWGLIVVARRSGARIYDYLQVIRGWLPAAGRAAATFTHANCVALDFPFYYSANVANELRTWQSQHPLFYTLPPNPDEARTTIAWLLEWILDERGAALMEQDEAEPLKTGADLRISLIADLVEHWAWVLEGPSGEAPAEDRGLFAVILEELNARISPRGRASLQRAWQQRHEKQLEFAGQLTGQERKDAITRKTKLEDLRYRLSTMAKTRDVAPAGGLL